MGNFNDKLQNKDNIPNKIKPFVLLFQTNFILFNITIFHPYYYKEWNQVSNVF